MVRRGGKKGDKSVPPPWLWGGWLRGFGSFRGFLGAGGAFPGGEFVGIPAVLVLDGGIKTGDDGLGLAEQGVDGGGAFDAFEVVAVFGGVAGVERVAVGAEVFHEVGGKFVGDESGAEGSFGGFGFWAFGSLVLQELEQGIRVGGDRGLDGGAGMAVGGIREAGIVQLDGAGGAGDVLEVDGEGLDEGLLADRAAELTDAGLGEIEDDGSLDIGSWSRGLRISGFED